MSFNATTLNIYFLRTISKFPNLLTVAQRFRYFLMRGPFQRFFVYYFRRKSRMAPAAILLGAASLFPPIDEKKTVAEIISQGYSACLQLPSKIVAEINDFRESETSTNIHHPHKKCEAIRQIASDVQLISIIRDYFQTEPIFYGSRLYYTPPRLSADGVIPAKYENAKSVHFDCTDFMDLSVFFYLDDVDLDTSPHIVIPGTNKGKKLKDFIYTRYTTREAEKRFRADFVTLTGNAGFGFIEDTGTFHIQSLGKKGRWVLSLCYTMNRRAEFARHQDVF